MRGDEIRGRVRIFQRQSNFSDIKENKINRSRANNFPVRLRFVVYTLRNHTNGGSI